MGKAPNECDEWLRRARSAIKGPGDPDMRAMMVLEAVKRLGPLARTPEQGRAVARVVHALDGFENGDKAHRTDMLGRATNVWLALEIAWTR